MRELQRYPVAPEGKVSPFEQRILADIASFKAAQARKAAVDFQLKGGYPVAAEGQRSRFEQAIQADIAKDQAVNAAQRHFREMYK